MLLANTTTLSSLVDIIVTVIGQLFMIVSPAEPYERQNVTMEVKSESI